jgi:hypothetical protein
MKYEYNYSFLERWMQANEKVDGKQILQAIGSTSNQSLRLYLDRKCPMPIISILRFCNTFHVPISAFIVDKEKYLGYADDSKGIETESEVIPLDSDAFEPVDGYIKNGDKRAHGSRSLRNPIDVTEQTSIVPGIIFKKNISCEPSGCASVTDNKSDAEVVESKTPDENTPITDVTEANYNRNLVDRLLGIINEQQKLMNDQQKEIAALTKQLLEVRANGNAMVRNTMMGIAADDIHHE